MWLIFALQKRGSSWRDGQFVPIASIASLMFPFQEAHREPLQFFCNDFGYEAVIFESTGGAPAHLPHQCYALSRLGFALAGLDLIGDLTQRGLSAPVGSDGQNRHRTDRNQSKLRR